MRRPTAISLLKQKYLGRPHETVRKRRQFKVKLKEGMDEATILKDTSKLQPIT